jgi:hyperosmotically inducible protein
MRTRTLASFGFVGFALALALAAAPLRADQPDDAWITSKVKVALLTDDVVDGLHVNVDTVEGRVTLHGQVDSEQEKVRAEERARAIEGVANVDNLLRVVPEAQRDVVERTDEQVKEAVEKALEDDRALEKSDVEVASVNEGVVLLRGEVETVGAEVRRVVSELRGPRELADREIWQDAEGAVDTEQNAVADGWITTKVKLALLSEEGVGTTSVNVDTDGGVVTLFGRVDSADAKQRAEQRARAVDGVKDVDNELAVAPDVAAGPGGQRDDGEIKDAVQKRIDARATLADADINVASTEGVVRLTGTVTSQRDRIAALTAARSAPGVRRVVDGLEVAAAGAR